MDGLIPIREWIEQLEGGRRVGRAWVSALCAAGRIPGACKLGRDWYVPAGAVLPDKRKPGKKASMPAKVLQDI